MTFEDFHDEIRNFASQYVQAMALDRNDVDDVIQMVMEGAFRNFGTLSDLEKLKGWVRQIAKNKVNDYIRKKYRSCLEYCAEPPDQAAFSTPYDEMVKIEERLRLQKMLNSLSENHKRVLYKKYILGMRSKEIAAQLGLTESQVNNMIDFARRKLGNKYGNKKNQ